jgi:hypothetical protein
LRRTGAAVSSSIAIPVDARSVTVSLSILQTDRIDTRNSVTFNVFKSADAGATWQHDCGATWTARVGGLDKLGTVEPNPSARWRGEALKSLAGKRLRVEVLANRLQTFSVLVDIS